MADLAPLTQSEEREALTIARADKRLGDLTVGRWAHVLARPAERERREPSDSRHALLGFYDYDQNRTIIAVVDLRSKRVEEAGESPIQLQLSAKEARDAERLASRDPQVRDLLAGRELNPLTRLYFPPWATRDDPPHRYAIVFARPSKHERRYVIVDLSTEAVIEVLAPDSLTKQ